MRQGVDVLMCFLEHLERPLRRLLLAIRRPRAVSSTSIPCPTVVQLNQRHLLGLSQTCDSCAHRLKSLEDAIQHVDDVLSQKALAARIVVCHQLLDCAANCLPLVLTVLELLADLIDGHVV